MNPISPPSKYLKRLVQLLTISEYDGNNLRLVGFGSEGFVFVSPTHIFKYFPEGRRILGDDLKFIQDNILQNKNISGLRALSQIIEHDDEIIFISPGETYTPYIWGDESGTLRILQDAKMNGYVHTNFKPANLMYDSQGNLRIIDLGRDIRPYDESLYKNMALRAYLTTYFAHKKNLPEILSAIHKEKDIDELKGSYKYISELTRLLGK